jgi:hypothetical protein
MPHPRRPPRGDGAIENRDLAAVAQHAGAEAGAPRAQLAMRRLHDEGPVRGCTRVGAGRHHQLAAVQLQAALGGAEAHLDGRVGVERQRAAVVQRPLAALADAGAQVCLPCRQGLPCGLARLPRGAGDNRQHERAHHPAPLRRPLRSQCMGHRRGADRAAQPRVDRLDVAPRAPVLGMLVEPRAVGPLDRLVRRARLQFHQPLHRPTRDGGVDVGQRRGRAHHARSSAK